MATRLSPNNIRVRFDEATLHNLYIEQSLTLEQIADTYGTLQNDVVPHLAYVIGVIATDGNLSSDRRHLAVSSQDLDLLETVRRCLRLDWLLGVGLMPAKSLKLGPLAVPDDFFRDFVRGCIHGDGSIVTYRDHFNTPKNPKYVYDRLFVSIVSASPRFLPWVQQTVLRLYGLSGHLTVQRSENHNDLWRLRYAKRESVSLLKWIYHAPDVPALRRKREHANRAMIGATWYRRSLSDIDTR